MILFLIIFFTIYGGVHVYAFFKARSVLDFGPWMAGALAMGMLFMTAAPVTVRVLEQYGYESAARAIAYIGYFWMGALFLFFCSSLLFDLISLIGRFFGFATRGDLSAFTIPAQLSFLVSLVLALLITAYGYLDAKNIRTEYLTIETEKLPRNVKKLTIAQISDVHLGLIVRCDRMEKILAKVKEANPDVLVSTGDLVDAQINHLPGLVKLLRQIKPRYGKYAVTGNHEYYAGLDRALAFTKQAGFRILRDEGLTNWVFNIAGVDDPTGVRMGLEKPASEWNILSKLPQNKFTILLKHRPRVDRKASFKFDLQLSGHTHGGQIFPFGLLSRIFYPMNSGMYVLFNESVVYASRGSGTWGPPVRFLASPEVTVIEVVRTK